MQLITGTVVPNGILLTESGNPILTEAGEYLLIETGGDMPTPIQALNRFNQPLYWQREPVSHTADGYPLDEDGVQIYAGTEETDWPVYVYAYTELIKAQFAFSQETENYIPALILGAGDETGRSQGFIQKLENALNIWYTSTSGVNNGIFIGNDYTDVVGLRKTLTMDFSR